MSSPSTSDSSEESSSNSSSSSTTGSAANSDSSSDDSETTAYTNSPATQRIIHSSFNTKVIPPLPLLPQHSSSETTHTEMSSPSSFSPTSPTSPPSPTTHACDDVFVPGDLVGEGITLAAEKLTLVPAPIRVSHCEDRYHDALRKRRRERHFREANTRKESKDKTENWRGRVGDFDSSGRVDMDMGGINKDDLEFDVEQSDEEERPPARTLEVVRRLGAGSYAVVYLVREVLEVSNSSSTLKPSLSRLRTDDLRSRSRHRSKSRSKLRKDRGDRRREEEDDDCGIIGGNFRDDVYGFDGFDGFVEEDNETDGRKGQHGFLDVNSNAIPESNIVEKNATVNGKKVDERNSKNGRVYGRDFALKVLSKVNLDEEALEAQMVEVNIHQSLPIHSNIVTLHRTLETSKYLILVLEFVPGEDLFYFLEQSRDSAESSQHDLLDGTDVVYGVDGEFSSPNSNSSNSSSTSSSTERNLPTEESDDTSSLITSCTPPTPSLLSTVNSDHLLSKERLKLIASMFGQMCDAVAVCHDVGVFHRDIKPENFIVTDGVYEESDLPFSSTSHPSNFNSHSTPNSKHLTIEKNSQHSLQNGIERIGNGRGGRRRRVVVKLTDFGLSTREEESGDMDCGSAPYMSYECRNNCAPTYSPRAADVWSLGIVLINMLYHVNPWTDTTAGACSSFSAYLANPEHFFATRFVGMNPSSNPGGARVAKFLAQRVFVLLPAEDPLDRFGRRVSARGLGEWVRGELVEALAGVVNGFVGVTNGPMAEGKMNALSLSLAIPVPRSPSPGVVTPMFAKRVQQSIASGTSSPFYSSATPVTPRSPVLPSPLSPFASALTAALEGQKGSSTFASSSIQPTSSIAPSTSASIAPSTTPSIPPSSTASPAFRHRRGLSNASIGHSLSSVPQSRRPSSRQASFSVPSGEQVVNGSGNPSGNSTNNGNMVLGPSRPTSAAGSRATTPLLRGRALAAMSSLVSRASSGGGARDVSVNGNVFGGVREEEEEDSSFSSSFGSSQSGMRSEYGVFGGYSSGGYTGYGGYAQGGHVHGGVGGSAGDVSLATIVSGEELEFCCEEVEGDMHGGEGIGSPLSMSALGLDVGVGDVDRRGHEEQDHDREDREELDREEHEQETGEHEHEQNSRSQRWRKRGLRRKGQQQQQLQLQHHQQLQQFQQVPYSPPSQQMVHHLHHGHHGQQPMSITSIPMGIAVSSVVQPTPLSPLSTLSVVPPNISSVPPSLPSTPAAAAAVYQQQVVTAITLQNIQATQQNIQQTQQHLQQQFQQLHVQQQQLAAVAQFGVGVGGAIGGVGVGGMGVVDSGLLTNALFAAGIGSPSGSDTVSPPTTATTVSANNSTIGTDSLETVASKTQDLARELSRTSRNGRNASRRGQQQQQQNNGATSPTTPVPPVPSVPVGPVTGPTATIVEPLPAPIPILPTTSIPNANSLALIPSTSHYSHTHHHASVARSSSSTPVLTNVSTSVPPVPPTPTTVSSSATTNTAPPTAAAISKKPSRWKLSFGKNSNNNNNNNSNSRPPLPSNMAPVMNKSTSTASTSSVSSSAIVPDSNLGGLSSPSTGDGGSSATAMSVTNVLKGLNSSVHQVANGPAHSQQQQQLAALSTSSSASSRVFPSGLPANGAAGAVGVSTALAQPEQWPRGRRNAGHQSATERWATGGNDTAFSFGPTGQPQQQQPQQQHVHTHSHPHHQHRNTSPTSLRTSVGGGRHGPGSSANSIAASSVSGHSDRDNWRSSASSQYSSVTSSSSASSSAFTRYSNGSVRSVNTANTSLSAGSSWRNGNQSQTSLASGVKGPARIVDRSRPPPNVKIMDGVPWIIDEFPRQLRPTGAEGGIFSEPSMNMSNVSRGKRPSRKAQNTPKDLPTINERPNHHHHAKSPLSQRLDDARSTSTIDVRLTGEGSIANESVHSATRQSLNNDDASSLASDRGDGAPRKVHKNQINALAKMLSALRR